MQWVTASLDPSCTMAGTLYIFEAVVLQRVGPTCCDWFYTHRSEERPFFVANLARQQSNGMKERESFGSVCFVVSS